jgi:NAD(P)-dependent dehydrogenase (short-subunit alcohol dehydrogenase family)
MSSALTGEHDDRTQLVADRYAAAGIRTNSVLPGHMDNYPESETNLAKIPMKRYAGVQEVAKTVRYLLSDDAGYITGQHLRVDSSITHSV